MSLNYIINEESIDILLYFIKQICINAATFYIGLKITNRKISKNEMWKVCIITAILTIIEIIAIKETNFLSGMMLIIVLADIIIKRNKSAINEPIVVISVISASISNCIFFISAVSSGIINLILKINNDSIALIFIVVIFFILVYNIMNIKKFRNGLTFLNKKMQGEFYDILMLNFGAIILLFIAILVNSESNATTQISWALIGLCIIMFLTIQKSFQVYYKQKLLIQELDETKSELKSKTDEVQKLEQENLNFSKKSHSLAHKQESLEYKLNQILLKSEIANEIGLTKELEEISKELYKKPTLELDKTGITKIDDMLNFMQSECIKNNIDFDLQLSGNIYYIINNIVTVEELEILLADHIKDAIIAIKHTDNINKSILVKLGKIDNTYGLYIYDSGIEFEKETLENLGKKPSTTHPDEGGTGMGFMNTFDTLKRCKGSLIINEIGKPSKDNYTKILMIKFDGKDEFKIISYRN